MKLEFRIGDKKLIEPKFEVFTHKANEDILVIVMEVILSMENKIRDAIDKDLFELEMNNGLIGLILNDTIYSFDIHDFLNKTNKQKENNHFFVGFAFFDNNGKIKREKGKVFRIDKE
ncbi:hypothetical protein GQ105_003396 [Salmonella enterica]|nr:hypothetical protein [Salmonella enterica]